jgi:hypothetical protein
VNKKLIRLASDGSQLLLGDEKKPIPVLKLGWVMLVIDTSISMDCFPRAVNPHLATVQCSRSTVIDKQTVSVPDSTPESKPLTGRTALDIAKYEAIEFANKARFQKYLTGLVGFGDEAKVFRHPQELKIPFPDSVAPLSAMGTTNMAAGIFVASGVLQEAPGEKAMVVLSDGLPNDEEKTIRAANSAKRLGVRIITIGVPGANEAFLQQIASASDLATLTDFDQLGNAMEKAVKLLPAPRSTSQR